MSDFAVAPTQFSYSDINALASLKRAPNGLEKVAEQFESLFIDIWLKQMRAANANLGGENYLNSDAVKTQQEMLDHQLAIHLGENGGFGLAKMITQQLGSEESAEP